MSRNDNDNSKPHDHDPAAIGVSEDAPHPETSRPLPESSEEESEETHNAPHADGYDGLAETTNDPVVKKDKGKPVRNDDEGTGKRDKP